MTSLPEQLSAASTRQISAQLDAQFSFFNTITTQALDNASRLVSLNLSASRDTVERSSQTVRQLLGATQPGDLMVLRSHAEEQVRSLFNYSRELFNIGANAQPYGLRTILPAAEPVAPAQVVEAAVEATVEAVEAVQETATVAARESSEAIEAVPAPLAPVAEPEPVPEPLALQQEDAPGASAEAQARVTEEAEPVSRQKPIARAAGGKGASKAASAPHPLAAPIEDQDVASVARINNPSKRRK